MNYCLNCPINNQNSKCIQVGRFSFNPTDYKQITNRNIPNRCKLDLYVVKYLSEGNPVTINLAQKTIMKSLQNKDRELLIAILFNASESILQLLWQILKNNEARSLTLLNPLLTAIGLAPISNIKLTKNSIQFYMNAIKNSPVFGNIHSLSIV